MTIQQASFQTRARAIDHLGRGQIADAPTAVSELWKNAYDAYARDVELHIFANTIPTACILDNGHGMTVQDLLEKWLVIGTDSKLIKNDRDNQETFGLPLRVRQGEKGIGRLSAAFLSPITLIVTKKEHHPYSLLLVDWRFFENPFLLIDDIRFPVQEIGKITDIPNAFPLLSQQIHAQLTFSGVSQRLQDAWNKFSALEKDNGIEVTTWERILNFSAKDALTPNNLAWWYALMKDQPESIDTHGTALFCFDAAPELSNWLEGNVETPEQESVRNTLRETLISFTDPLQEKSIFFNYGVYIHKPEQPTYTVLESKDVFTLDDFTSLEHWARGEVDENGVFTGSVTAYGKDCGTVTITPRSYTPSKDRRSKLGPFKLSLGTFEQERRNSTLSDEEFERLLVLLEKYAGISMYRDGLRVLPYGREGADLFSVEKRRTLNAGRYFYSYRRTLGGVSFTSRDNPNLKDKAGREGLIDNKARRSLVQLVTNIMLELAERYYGRHSNLRRPALAKANKLHEQRKKAAEKLRKRTKKNFRAFLNDATPKVAECALRAQVYLEDLQQILNTPSQEKDKLFAIRDAVTRLDQQRDELKLLIPPFDDGEFEDKYRLYRDAYNDFCVALEKLKEEITKLEADGFLGAPKDVLSQHFSSNQAKLSHQVTTYKNNISVTAKQLVTHWEQEASEDTKKYYAALVNDLIELENTTHFRTFLNRLDKVYLEFRDQFELKYTPVLNSLEQIHDIADVEGAWLHTEKENIRLHEKVAMLHSVAQLGITVEIIGHELAALESQIGMQMRLFPQQVKELNAYKLLVEAQQALIDRLRFLAPLKKTTSRSRVPITGKEIDSYIRKFFSQIFNDTRCELITTDAFKTFRINDLPSRIYPAFINLINNAVYWVQFTEDEQERQIALDRKGNLIIISDTGPGVDIDDVEKLFDLFFTRRPSGRGLGLYLCQQNFGVVGHQLRYATTDDPKYFNGANFIIELKGAEYND